MDDASDASILEARVARRNSPTFGQENAMQCVTAELTMTSTPCGASTQLTEGIFAIHLMTMMIVRI